VSHKRHCLAASMIAAVENFRDAAVIMDAEFAEFAKRDVLATAEGYLSDGTMTCQCKTELELRIDSIDPDATYFAELIDYGTVGLVSGATARDMLRGSTSPDLLRFHQES
jgi:hypothetical protein